MSIDQALASSGERLRRARILAGISTRREFEEKHQISANTLQGWEQGKNPLSQKGARRVINALKEEGLICTVEWLINGTGMPSPIRSHERGIRKELQQTTRSWNTTFTKKKRFIKSHNYSDKTTQTLSY